MSDAPDSSEPLPRTLVTLALVLVLVGAVARAAACLTDFWLDEVWTWELAAGLSSPLAVLTGIHHSNNHHLNTLFVHVLGAEVSHWAVYRLPSLVAGLASIALLGRLAGRRGRLEGWLAAGLGASSYLLVFHASEARGYALVVFFALLAFAQLDGLLRAPTWKGGLLFGATVLCGFLSHLQFVHVWSAALVWSVWRLLRSRRDAGSVATDLLRCHGPAFMGLVVLYLVDIRHLVIGGGPPYELLDVLGSTAALALGVPRLGVLPVLALIALAGVLVAGLVSLARRGDDAWTFHLVAIVLSPAALLLALRPEVLFERYFVVAHALWLLLAADLAGGGWRAGGARRLAASLLILAAVSGNAIQVARYLRDGRGRYLEALEYVTQQTPGSVTRVASDDDFRNGRLVAFYGPWLPDGEQVIYVPTPEWSDAVDWFLVHSRTESSPREFELWIGEQRYVFARRFPHGSHSGWDWFVFRRDPR